ncbi:MAG: A/G-specific adenine glycosylase [Tannerella sp.]|jgi:A/G-specific adenine glycosylase|nr:A/G-specific adenine glycosylase [Tannerella sp.]
MSYHKKIFKESELLRTWYATHKRDLPWRNIKDPYRIWISEVILQQTRVAQGLDYYNRFVGRFPDARSLAEADQKEVLKYWQGLGYYSRARNLHEAAKDIQSRFNGIFPGQYDDVLTLKGIGEYTAAAIVSFAWNQPRPVIDGNVYRVLGRLFGITTPMDTGKGKQEYRELATLLMPPDQAGVHNQAIMEFGALQCIPQNPDCEKCPLSGSCAACASGNPQQYPVKQNKTKTRNRYFHYFFIICRSHTYLHCRTGKDIWEGLYEFPLIESDVPADFAELQEKTTFTELFRETGQPAISLEIKNRKHVLSHQVLYATFYKVEIQKENAALKKYLKIPLSALDEYPFPRLVSAFLSREEK